MDIFNEVKQLIIQQIKRRQVDSNELTKDTQLETLGLDSLDLAELVMNIEEKFEIKEELQQEELINIKTINDIVKIVESRLAK